MKSRFKRDFPLCPIIKKPVHVEEHVCFDQTGFIVSNDCIHHGGQKNHNECSNSYAYLGHIEYEERDMSIYIIPTIVDGREMELQKLLTFRDVCGLSEEIVCKIFSAYLNMYHRDFSDEEILSENQLTLDHFNDLYYSKEKFDEDDVYSYHGLQKLLQENRAKIGLGVPVDGRWVIAGNMSIQLEYDEECEIIIPLTPGMFENFMDEFQNSNDIYIFASEEEISKFQEDVEKRYITNNLIY